MSATVKGIEENRAIFAYECVKKVHDKDHNKKYKAYVKRIPGMIKNNGLGPALAFVYSKKSEKAYDTIYTDISRRLKDVGLLGGEDLIEAIVKKNSSEYREITMEVLALFSWLRRFAEGMIEGEVDE